MHQTSLPDRPIVHALFAEATLLSALVAQHRHLKTKTMGSKGGFCVQVVDLSAFIYGEDLEQREKTARVLADCCRLNGCVGITGHGVPMELLERAFVMSKRLFDLPLEDKLKAPYPEGMTPHRGYSGVGREKGGAKGALDTDDQETKISLLRASDYKVSF